MDPQTLAGIIFVSGALSIALQDAGAFKAAWRLVATWRARRRASRIVGVRVEPPHHTCLREPYWHTAYDPPTAHIP